MFNQLVYQLLWTFLVINAGIVDATAASRYKVVDVIDIARVASGFPVNYCLLTSGSDQYVAYYDTYHRMTVAHRSLDSSSWNYKVLPTKIGWDSHNYITMSLDNQMHLHVSGNMHAVPLIYFRTTLAGDISSLTKFSMVGNNEERCTYPKFLRGPDNRLIFHYRDGGSGNGNEIFNVYNEKSASWKRFIDKPLFDGQGKMNAYIHGPVRGPDGWYHIHWVWRDTPDCSTNHHLSYARSLDLVHWESAFGERVQLPIVLKQKELWVDPIPSGGGIINGGAKLFFDTDHQPVLNYHKSDDAGNMQAYASRPSLGIWKTSLLTNWSYPIHFGGKGSMGFIGIRLGDLKRIEPEILKMTYRHKNYGSGHILLDEKTLKPIKKKLAIPVTYPNELRTTSKNKERMQVNIVEDISSFSNESERYVLRWETLRTNHDKPPTSPLPEDSALRVYKLILNEHMSNP